MLKLMNVLMWLNVRLYVKYEFETLSFLEVLNDVDDYDVDSFGDCILIMQLLVNNINAG